MKKYLKEIDDKIEQLTNIAKVRLEQEDLTAMEEHNLDDTLQTFVINMLSGDTTKVGWMNPDTSTNSLRKIKPFCEIYESEIVFYAFTNNLPFQSEPCPHMNEGIRTDIREFLNSLENQRSGIKNNLYQSIIKH